MTALSLDHINIQTRDMARTIAFYRDLLGLEAKGAPRRDPAERQWLYAGVRAVIHLNLFGTGNTVARDVQPGAATGAIHHVAFECDDFDACLARIEAMGLDHGFADLPEIGLKQLFVTDPDNVLLELNFRRA